MLWLLLALAALVGVTQFIRQRAVTCAAARKALLRQGKRPLRVAMLHPDLGIGGAERLVIDMALGIQGGHRASQSRPAAASPSGGDPGPCTVQIFTNFHDPQRAFAETVDGSLFPIIVLGSWIPRHIRNRGHVLFATLRMAWAAAAVVVRYQLAADMAFDVFIVDQVAAAMPVLKLLAPKTPIYFYCHFPDQLCDPNRMPKAASGGGSSYFNNPVAAAAPQGNLLRRAYRAVFDRLEAATMRAADEVNFNSQFTRAVSLQVFQGLAAAPGGGSDVLYPPISVEALLKAPPPADPPAAALVDGESLLTEEALAAFLRAHRAVVSINRFERKKNIPLAVAGTAAYLRTHSPGAPVALVICGGYDARLPENVDHYSELVALCSPGGSCADVLRPLLTGKADAPTREACAAAVLRPGIGAPVLFLRSCTARAKHMLLANACAVLYTPTNEHFGIVPVEAMAFGRVVIAVSSGGPLESIGEGDAYGLLRRPEAALFGEALAIALDEDKKAAREVIEANAARRAREVFDIPAFAATLRRKLLALAVA